jgi:hypothetical protein
MLTSLFGRCIGLSAVVCILLLFFFPLAQGSFQSTHGPVATLRSKRFFLLLVWSIVSAGLRLFAMLLPRVTFEQGRKSPSGQSLFISGDHPACCSVLRC